MGLMIAVGDVSGLAKGSMGLMIVPTSLGASRIGIRSRLGWNCRRARMNLLPPSGRERENGIVRKVGELGSTEEGLSGDPGNALRPCDWSRAGQFRLAHGTVRRGKAPWHGLHVVPAFFFSARPRGHFSPAGSSAVLRGVIQTGVAAQRWLFNDATLVKGADFSRNLVVSPHFDTAVQGLHRVKFRREECKTGRTIEGAAVVLLDGTRSEPFREVRTGGTMRRDVESQGREARVSRAEDGAQSPPLAEQILSSPDFTLQLGTQLTDDSTDALSVPLTCFGLGEIRPGVSKRSSHGL